MEHDSLIPPETHTKGVDTDEQLQERKPTLLVEERIPNGSEADSHSFLEDEQKPRPFAQKQASTRLHFSVHIVFVVLLYAFLAIFSWVVLNILAIHPLTLGDYGVNIGSNRAYNWGGAYLVHSLYEKNEEYLQATRVINSIVAVLTIPLTSTVCSKAAVAFIQRKGAQGLTLRQTITLADRGWSDPGLYFKLLLGGFKKYGTSFLFESIVLNAIGAVISPLQSVYMTTTTAKTPTRPVEVIQLTDLTQFAQKTDFDQIGVQLQASMMATSNTDPQARLWTQDAVECIEPLTKDNDTVLPDSCFHGGAATLANISLLSSPFLAQLPSGYSTGLLKQFLPRVNSTAHRRNITESEYPTNCSQLPGAFYVRYGSTTNISPEINGWGNWSLEACMPANMTHSPWRATRDRQDFSEDLYLNISVASTGPGAYYVTPEDRGGLFRITLNTTAGYFELPNYMNGQRPGPVLDKDPMNPESCGEDCYAQASLFSIIPRKSIKDRSNEPDDVDLASNSTLELEMQDNRGPLATIAMALFGPGSFIGLRMKYPEMFIYPNYTSYEAYVSTPNADACIAQVPFMSLLRDQLGQYQIGNFLEPCLESNVRDHDTLMRQMATYAYSFYYNTFPDTLAYGGKGSIVTAPTDRIENAFTAAAFLANEVWLTSIGAEGSWSVYYDLGADTVIPVISPTGRLVVSVLMGIFLVSLLGLAIYSAITPRWTDTLNSFAMLRLGASMPNDLQLQIARDVGKIKALDTLPGWIGDATDGEGPIGQLALGAHGALNRKRQYAAHSTDAASSL